MFRTLVVLCSLLISVSLATAETVEKPKLFPEKRGRSKSPQNKP